MTQSQEDLERRFVPTPSGTLHVAMAGAGAPVLLLHQTPRSWDEYRDVLPLLGRHLRAMAMDTIGFGDSAPVRGEASIEACAEAALQLLTALGHARAAVMGHHTGAVIAMEMAARAPDRVTALVLSSCPMVDAARRAAHDGKRPIDAGRPDPGRAPPDPALGAAPALLSGGRYRIARAVRHRRAEGRADGGRGPPHGQPLPDGGTAAAASPARPW